VRPALGLFVYASLPAALAGVWNLGARVREASLQAPATPGPWQVEMLRDLGIGLEQPGPLPAVAIGCAFLLPLLLTSLAVSRAWAEGFARLRGRPLDPGWALTAWLYTLLLPATMPLHFAALGLSFGVVFGCHVFGGSGRYIVNPALLGIAYAAIAHPSLLAGTQWLPGASVPSSWAAVAADGIAAGVAGGPAWLPLFLGNRIGALGTPSALACLLGAAFLIARGAASPRIVLAAVAGLALASGLLGALPWYWHLALGNFAFVLAFVATDPTTRPLTAGGCWAYGALFGVLTIVLRVADPEHPEGTGFALLLASLCAPLLDHLATRSARWRQPEPLRRG
jgi:Na+-transporting NADH:ubiquinone oxidoreductase subunit B